jgi:hypothetical protein
VLQRRGKISAIELKSQLLDTARGGRHDPEQGFGRLRIAP